MSTWIVMRSSSSATAAQAASSQAWSGSVRIVGLPSPSRTTKRSDAPRAFLSTRITACSRAQSPAYRVGRPIAAISVRCRSTSARVEQPGLPGELGGEHQADGDRLAVPPAEVLHPLDGVAEGVPVVEELAAPGVVEVLAHGVGLDLHGALDELLGVAPAGRVGVEQVEDRAVGDEAALDHLGQPRAELRLGQAGQRVGVGQHGGRRVEGADEVLAGARC